MIDHAKPYTLKSPPPDYWYIHEEDTGQGFRYELIHIGQDGRQLACIPWIGRERTWKDGRWVVTDGQPVVTENPYYRGALNHLASKHMTSNDIFYVAEHGFRHWGTIQDDRLARRAQ